jgi:glycosyltransferase involved in cell wall biosynthesis
MRRYAVNISCSHAVRDSLQCGGEVIPNPYDHRRFKLFPEHRDRAIAFVGRLVSDKGVDVLLRAMRRLRVGGTQATLTIVGDGPERRALEALTAEYALQDQVDFVGAQSHDDLPAILNRHLILVAPSLWEEPFGIVALEGAACGCVVVGSQGGGLAEAIGPCGETFPNGDDGRLSEILDQLLSNPSRRQAFRDAAPLHLARHRIDAIASRYLEVFMTSFTASGHTI